MALTDGLISVWHLNESSGESLVEDSFGSNNGTRMGATQDTLDKMLGPASLDFDSIDDNVIIPHHPSLAPDYISISVWVKPRIDPAQQVVVEKPYSSFSNPYYDYMLMAYTGASRTVLNLNIGGIRRTVSSDGYVFGNNWHHIIGTYDGSYIRLYVDGYYRAVSSLYSGTISKTGKDLRFGEHELNALDKLDGNADEINMWDRALTDGGISINALAGGEIAELWNDGDGIELGVSGAQIFRRRMEGY